MNNYLNLNKDDEVLENLFSYISKEVLVLIPVLYILNVIINDKYIPLILLPIASAFSIFILGFNANAFVNDILALGASLYVNHNFNKVIVYLILLM